MKDTSASAKALAKAFEKNMVGKYADHTKVPSTPAGAEKVAAALSGEPRV
jgi:hypothetical protein